MPATETAQAKMTVRCTHCAAWNRISADRAVNGPKCGKCAKPIALDRPVMLTDETFARTIAESDVPIGRALIAKLDTDHSPQTAGSFNIRGIPTTIVFRGGREAARQTGAVPKAELERLLGT